MTVKFAPDVRIALCDDATVIIEFFDANGTLFAEARCNTTHFMELADKVKNCRREDFTPPIAH